MATSRTYTEEKDIDWNAEENILYMLGGDDEVSGVNPDFVDIYGGIGNDDLSYGMVSETIPLNGTVTLHGGIGDDQLDDGAGVGTSYLYGESGNDILDSDRSTGESFLYGGDGNDELWGNEGDDLIDKSNSVSATAGSEFYGGKGNDLIVSKASFDELHGGGGKDTFQFGRNIESGYIADFSIKDTINLKKIDAIDDKNGNQNFVFIGKKSFSDKSGELRFSKDKLKADTDGDGSADIVIKVEGDNINVSDLNL